MNTGRILVVDDEANIRELLEEILSEEGYEVTTAADAEHARAARRQKNYDLTLLDIWMPDTDGISLLKEWADGGALDPVVMMSGHGTVDTAVEATRLGALDFIEKPVSLTELLRTVSKALETRRSKDGRKGRRDVAVMPVGKSQAMRQLRQQVQSVARHDTHILFSGEPGSGRKLFGRYLVSQSARSGAPFELIAGRSLTTESADDLLLGTEHKAGALKNANGGVLFIDGLDAASDRAQQILIETLESRHFDTASGTINADLRVLSSVDDGPDAAAALDERLRSLVGIIDIRIPPLREYSEDVPELLKFYADYFVDQERLPFRRFSVAAQNRLRNYPWPGNVRELRDVVKRLLILGADEEIGLAEVEAQLTADAPATEPLIKQDLLAMPLREAREHFERAYLQQQLILCGGKVGQLAKRVGMERTHLYRKLRALGVDFRQTAGEDDAP